MLPYRVSLLVGSLWLHQPEVLHKRHWSCFDFQSLAQFGGPAKPPVDTVCVLAHATPSAQRNLCQTLHVTVPFRGCCLAAQVGTMVRISVLHDALKTMYNAEKRGKRQVLIRPASKVVIKFLQLMMKHGYIGEFEFVDDHRAGKIVVNLNGRLNKCGCISPRYDVGVQVCL